MALFTDTVTIYQKKGGAWLRTVVSGVQWSDVRDKSMATGRLTMANSASITFPRPTLGLIDFSSYTEEDAIFYGELDEEITEEPGSRLSDLLEVHHRGGIIRSVNDNSDRDRLANIKVVVF